MHILALALLSIANIGRVPVNHRTLFCPQRNNYVPMSEWHHLKYFFQALRPYFVVWFQLFKKQL